MHAILIDRDIEYWRPKEGEAEKERKIAYDEIKKSGAQLA